MLVIRLMKTLLLSLITILLLTGCINRHGISAKYYSECKEYYDYQGYYHNECGDDDIITYEKMSDKITTIFDDEKPEPKGNVW